MPIFGKKVVKKSRLIADDPAVDLAVTEAMVNHLKDYILRDELYQTVIASTPRGEQSLQMTGGDLLTRLYRLPYLGDELTSEQTTLLETLQISAQETIEILRTRFHERLTVELKSRLNSLSWFLDDCADDAQRFRVEYPFEIRNRQRIEEILKVIGNSLDDALLNRLAILDERIRSKIEAGNFVWDVKLKSAFPNEPYWYLYVSLIHSGEASD